MMFYFNNKFVFGISIRLFSNFYLFLLLMEIKKNLTLILQTLLKNYCMGRRYLNFEKLRSTVKFCLKPCKCITHSPNSSIESWTKRCHIVKQRCINKFFLFYRKTSTFEYNPWNILYWDSRFEDNYISYE